VPSLKPEISICVPSRGRPLQLKAMIESSLNLAESTEGIEFLIYADDDDLSMTKFSHPSATVLRGKRQTISTMTNLLASVSRGSLIMYAADDIIFRTENWDSLVLEHYANSVHKICLIHGEDLGQDANKIATHGFISRDLYKLLGYILPNFFKADFCDTWMTEICVQSGTRSFDPNLIIEHMHPAWGKAPIDDTYRSTKISFYFLNLIRYQILWRNRKKTIRKIKNYCAALSTNDSSSA
jgi:hypothetical protein